MLSTFAAKVRGNGLRHADELSGLGRSRSHDTPTAVFRQLPLDAGPSSDPLG